VVTLSHVYVERRVTPLNVALRDAEESNALVTLGDYARALGDLAACNIFPGDLLLKNFGVTRHGRVVFYDYDEVMSMEDVNFREIPEPRSWEDEMSSEPWFSVGPNDVFPEEFPRFLSISRPLKRAVQKDQPQIFLASWWRRWQRKAADGEVPELRPYPKDRRLRWVRHFHIP